jgi:hypothetical protein
METTCTRCHQTIPAGTSFCSYCGLPQLVYSGEAAGDPGEPARWHEAVRDAGSVVWPAALRPALALGIPAGVMCSFLSPVGILGFVLMGLAGAWVVSLYVRHRQPAWITLGAGARIGMVTGIVGSWTAAATTAITLFALRYGAHRGHIFDDFWSNFVNRQLTQEWNTMGVDAQTVATLKGMLLSPEGRAGWVLSALCFLTIGLLIFAVAGGALSARIQIRRRRPHL